MTVLQQLIEIDGRLARLRSLIVHRVCVIMVQDCSVKQEVAVVTGIILYGSNIIGYI